MRGVYLKKGNTKVTVVPYYRIGDLFLTTNAANPSSFLGGTWQLFGPGKCLVCVDTSDNDFKTVKKTGGAKTVTLSIEQIPSHGHTMNEAGNHNHGVNFDQIWGWGGTTSLATTSGGPYGGSGYIHYGGSHTHTINNTGGGKAHNNLQPYITCYIWIRTA